MSAVIYVSGLPGVGKTSVVNHLVDTTPERCVRLSFGELLRNATAPSASTESFRRSASGVDRAAIEAATTAGTERIRNELSRVVLIDSHAVTPVTEGLRATPDTVARVMQFGYSVTCTLTPTGPREGSWETAAAKAGHR